VVCPGGEINSSSTTGNTGAGSSEEVLHSQGDVKTYNGIGVLKTLLCNTSLAPSKPKKRLMDRLYSQSGKSLKLIDRHSTYKQLQVNPNDLFPQVNPNDLFPVFDLSSIF